MNIYNNKAMVCFSVISYFILFLSIMISTGQDRRIVVVLNDITRDIAIEGVALSQRELRDLNRGRSYLRDLAQTHCTVVEPSVEEGIRTVTDVSVEQHWLKVTHTCT